MEPVSPGTPLTGAPLDSAHYNTLDTPLMARRVFRACEVAMATHGLNMSSTEIAMNCIQAIKLLAVPCFCFSFTAFFFLSFFCSCSLLMEGWGGAEGRYAAISAGGSSVLDSDLFPDHSSITAHTISHKYAGITEKKSTI